MSAEIIDGQAVAAKVRAEIAAEIEEITKAGKIAPGIAVILVGEDPASQIYVSTKEKTAKELGMNSVVLRLPKDTTEEELLKVIDDYNKNNEIHGILVQLPLPEHINEMNVLLKVTPEKDVDGFHPQNVGLLNIGEATLVSCTPFGVMRLLKEYNVDIEGKHAVVVGRSNIVGKPMAALLLKANATVTICHSRTKNMEEITKQADILVAAVGKAGLIKKEHVKKGAVVIDVGTNRVDGKLKGDVDFEEVKEVASKITPVPKGVGPMTIAMLMNNTLVAYKNLNK